jgi:hypothetical protein
MRLPAITVTLSCVLLSVACSNSATEPRVNSRPFGTPTSASYGSPNGANWTADAIVVSATGAACGWGTAPGETRSGVYWKISATADLVTLDEDMRNWPTDDVPYSGSLSGKQFAATYTQDGSGVCAFRGGDLSGRFTEDGLHFEAIEHLQWGSPGYEVRVERRWTGTRR